TVLEVCAAWAGKEAALGMTTMRALRAPPSRTKRRSTVARPTLSLAPPMMSRLVCTVLAIATAEASVMGQVRGGRRSAVGFIGILDLLARDPQQIQHGVQIGHIDCGVGLFAHDRFRVERDSETGGSEHVQVVGAVADGHRP